MKPGDVVQLKSGGPSMTVKSVYGGRATCIWFDYHQSGFQNDTFSTLCLQAPPPVPALDLRRKLRRRPRR